MDELDTYRKANVEEVPSKICVECMHAHHFAACTECGRWCGLRRVARVGGALFGFTCLFALVGVFVWMRKGGAAAHPGARLFVGVALVIVTLSLILLMGNSRPR